MDAAVVSTIVDAAVLVVRENFTKRQTVLQAYDQLQKAGGHVVGVAMNYCNVEKSDYYYAYYNQQGKREKGAESVPQVDARQFAPEQARKSGKHGSHGGAANPAELRPHEQQREYAGKKVGRRAGFALPYSSWS